MGQPAHERDILEHLMAAAVRPHRDARMRGADLHIEVGIGHGVADLVVGTSRSEYGEGAGEGHVAGQRQPGGHIDHVLLGDAHVEEALARLRRARGELGGGGAAGEVRIHGDDGDPLLEELDERGAEGGAGGLLLGGLF